MAAFIHESVKREGIRDLLHLNPIPFRAEEEITEKLPGILNTWRLEKNTGTVSLSAKDELRASGPHNYFYRNNNAEGPYCPYCWQKYKKEVLLPASEDYFSGHGRLCRVCKELFIEGPKKRTGGPVRVFIFFFSLGQHTMRGYHCRKFTAK